MIKFNRDSARFLLAFAGCTVLTFSSDAQVLPPTINIVVGYPAGAATDAVARMVAEQLSTRLDRTVVVENKPGANTILGTVYVARAKPDGATLLFTGSSHASNPAVYKKLPYDSLNDFASVGQVGGTPSLIAVNPALAVTSLAELLDLARKQPGDVRYGTAGHGSPPHLAEELLNSRANVRMTHVPYKGGGPALNDAIAGHIPVIVGGLPTIAPSVKGGRLRAIAITTEKRSALMPEVPTVAESGFPGFDVDIWYALLTQAKAPREVINTINKALNEALQDENFRRRLNAIGVEPKGGTPEMLDDMLRKQVRMWNDLVKANNIERVE